MSEVVMTVKRRGRPVGSKNSAPMKRMSSIASALRLRAYNMLENSHLYNINSGVQNPQNDIEWTFDLKKPVGRKSGAKMEAYKSLGDTNLDYKKGELQADGSWVFPAKNKVGRPAQPKQSGDNSVTVAEEEENAFDDDDDSSLADVSEIVEL